MSNKNTQWKTTHPFLWNLRLILYFTYLQYPKNVYFFLQIPPKRATALHYLASNQDTGPSLKCTTAVSACLGGNISETVNLTSCKGKGKASGSKKSCPKNIIFDDLNWMLSDFFPEKIPPHLLNCRIEILQGLFLRFQLVTPCHFSNLSKKTRSCCRCLAILPWCELRLKPVLKTWKKSIIWTLHHIIFTNISISDPQKTLQSSSG